MDRFEMLRKLHAVKKPLVSLTAFSDGVTCEYMSSRGCGGFELLDWGDLDEHNYDAPSQIWEEMNDSELKEWVDRLENDEFTPVDSLERD